MFETDRMLCMTATVTEQNFIHEGTKIRLNLGNACYNSFQNLLPLRLQFKHDYLFHGAGYSLKIR